jgi:predicted cobalt transporter CbtA
MYQQSRNEQGQRKVIEQEGLSGFSSLVYVNATVSKAAFSRRQIWWVATVYCL